MKFKIDHDYHIHTHLSSCSRDEKQTVENILAYAKEAGLSKICVTDHYWDAAVPGASAWYAPQNFDHIKKSLPLPKADGVEFLFGCECDMDKFFTVGIPKERFDEFDFIIIPTTHMHMTGFAISAEDAKSYERRAELWVERFDALLNTPLPFYKVGIAHLACRLINKSSREEYLKTLDLIPSHELQRLFSRAAELGCGIELNQNDMSFSDSECEQVLRLFRIAKSCGCKFYLGSDAHHPATFEKSHDVFERAINLLGLTEDDKFKPTRK